MLEIKGGQLKQPSGILYSPLLLLSLYAWPKFNQPIPEGGKDLHRGPPCPPPEINSDTPLSSVTYFSVIDHICSWVVDIIISITWSMGYMLLIEMLHSAL